MNPLGVLPHERTMPGPERRIAWHLLEACPVNFSPIYAIHRATREPDRPLRDHRSAGLPSYRFADDAGVLHRAWRIDATARSIFWWRSIAPGPLVIADGHHRYETALDYHGLHDREPEGTRRSCVSVSTRTSRSSWCSPTTGPSKLPTICSIDSVPCDFTTNQIDTAKPIESTRRSRKPITHSFSSAARGASLVEVGTDEVARRCGDRGSRHGVRLDVVVLHEVVFPRAGIDQRPDELAFTRDLGAK